MKRITLALVSAALGTSCSMAMGQLQSSGECASEALAGGNYRHTITIQNTGTTTIGTFWFAWIPGGDFLPSLPTNETAPAGWRVYVIPSIYDTYSIEWYATSPAAYIAPGASLSGFGFESSDSPDVLRGPSSTFPGYSVADSFVYIGGAFEDDGYLFTVTVPGGGSGCGTTDFNGDGDFGTDADIEAFFACLAGNCCGTCFSGGADFNADGDTGTDADIEAFFRVLAGGDC